MVAAPRYRIIQYKARRGRFAVFSSMEAEIPLSGRAVSLYKGISESLGSETIARNLVGK